MTKSKEEHKRDGTYRKDRHQGVAVGNTGLEVTGKTDLQPMAMVEIHPTIEIEGYALDFFMAMAITLKERGTSRPEDSALITHLAISAETIRDAYKSVREVGYVTPGRSGPVRNPMFVVLKDAMKDFSDLSKQLGIGPVSRAKLELVGLDIDKMKDDGSVKIKPRQKKGK